MVARTGDVRPSLSAWVGYVQARAPLRNRRINRKNPAIEFWQNARTKPCAHDRALSRVFAFKLQNTDFQLKDGEVVGKEML